METFCGPSPLNDSPFHWTTASHGHTMSGDHLEGVGVEKIIHRNRNRLALQVQVKRTVLGHACLRTQSFIALKILGEMFRLDRVLKTIVGLNIIVLVLFI